MLWTTDTATEICSSRTARAGSGTPLPLPFLQSWASPRFPRRGTGFYSKNQPQQRTRARSLLLQDVGLSPSHSMRARAAHRHGRDPGSAQSTLGRAAPECAMPLSPSPHVCILLHMHVCHTLVSFPPQAHDTRMHIRTHTHTHTHTTHSGLLKRETEHLWLRQPNTHTHTHTLPRTARCPSGYSSLSSRCCRSLPVRTPQGVVTSSLSGSAYSMCRSVL